MLVLICVCPYSVEVVDYISRVAASKVRHGHSDLLVVVSQVDADIFLQLLTPAQRGIGRVFIEHPAVKQVLLWDLHPNIIIIIQINSDLKISFSHGTFSVHYSI